MYLAPRILLGLISCLAVLAATAGQQPQQAVIAQLQGVALSDDTAWELLESLTTEVGPRMGGTPGDALAVQWAKNRLGKLGFDRVWTEEVSFPYWERVSESAQVMAPRAQALAMTALGGSPGTEGPLRGEVLRFADLESLEAANPLEVEGRIAFITKRMERHADGAGYGGTVSGRTRGPFVAADKGALALIIRSVGTANDRFPHTGTISTSQTGEPVPAAAVSNPDADLMEAMLDRGQEVIVELDLDCGYRGTAVSHNVIGEFDGRELTGDFVVVGGHLDSWDLGTGAMDDGAGVAITMAAAKLVADLPQRPRRGVRVVLFANEEQGIYGGKAYARAHQHELAAHVLGAESDLGSGRIYRFRSRVAPGAEAAMLELERLLEPLDIPWSQDRLASCGADLGQMRMLGMPVLDLNHDASRYFDLHHTANDTLDKVDPADLRFNVAAYATMIYWAAETEAVFVPVAPSE
jgi:hypothetical protein